MQESNMNLTAEEEKEFKSIVARWNKNRKNFCEQCMYDAIRHYDRNMDPACGSDAEASDADERSTEHPDPYSGEKIAGAPGDIWTLIRIIERYCQK